MKSELEYFLAEGLKKYKKASEIMCKFYENVQEKLQKILKNREDWRVFVPGEVNKVKSTKYWDKYPFINAQIPGTIEGKPATIKIGINWYESDTDYPFYCIWFHEIHDRDKFDKRINYYKKQGNVESYEYENGTKMLIFHPDQNDFNLERDFNLLINEFLKAISY